MAVRYLPVKVRKDIHSSLIRVKGLVEYKTGRRYSMNDVIEHIVREYLKIVQDPSTPRE